MEKVKIEFEVSKKTAEIFTRFCEDYKLTKEDLFYKIFTDYLYDRAPHEDYFYPASLEYVFHQVEKKP